MSNSFTNSTPGNAGETVMRGWWLLVLFLLGGFVVWTYGELRGATSPAWQDTSGYLSHALYIVEHGGLIGFLRECFNGTFPITERHPLYMLMLLPFASRTAEFFWLAKMVDLVTGLAVLVSLVWMVSRRYGKAPALIAGTLYALSTSLVLASSHVDNETQFTLCALWMWWLLTEPRRDSESAPAVHMPIGVTQWALGGVCLGLAFLAKSPAILIALAVVLGGLWYGRTRFLLSWRLWVFVLATLLVSSPLLVRNIVGFGTPLYEGMNSNITWVDDWSETGSEHSSMYFDQYGVMTIEVNGMPTARDYWRTHTVSDIGRRLVVGLDHELTRVVPSALKFAVPPRDRVATAYGFIVLGFAFAGWWLRRWSWEGSLVFFWTGGFLVFFGWDHMFPDLRYLAPLVPIWIALAAYAMWLLLLKFMKSQIAWRVVGTSSAAAVLVAVGWTLGSGTLTQAQPLMAVSPSYMRLNNWFNRTIVKGDRVMYGPSREFHGLIWVIERPISMVLVPNAKTLEGFLGYLRERKVRYLVMHPENIEGEGGILKDALSPYFGVSPAGEILEKKRLPGWHPVYVDEGSPRHFIVYESEAWRPEPPAVPR